MEKKGISLWFPVDLENIMRVLSMILISAYFMKKILAI